MGLVGYSDHPISYTVPTPMVFRLLQGHTTRPWLQTYPWRLTDPPHFFLYLFPPSHEATPQPAGHITEVSLAICWETWPLLGPEVQVYIILVNTNAFTGNTELSSCLFLNVSSPPLVFPSLCHTAGFTGVTPEQASWFPLLHASCYHCF